METNFAPTFFDSVKRIVNRQKWYWKTWDFLRYDMPRFFRNLWMFRKDLYNYRWYGGQHAVLPFMKTALLNMASNIDERGMEVEKSKDKKVAKTVLQDVVILSIGRYITNNVARSVEVDSIGGKEKIRSLAEDYSFTTVTLEVDPIQVQTISLLLNSEDNALTLALRNNDDVERVNLPDTTLFDVYGDFLKSRGGAQKR